ncbi:MAG: hypothetical protein DWH91_02015 [Planctomycetota bacterium]|nr:MAG: hypothetical protein DWH91_02015 [Planctomycetota bacterium]
MSRRRKLLIFGTLAALALLVGSLWSDPLSPEEQLFVGDWQAVKGSPDPFEGSFGTDRWMVTHHHTYAVDYRWRVRAGELIVTETYTLPKGASIRDRLSRLIDVMVAKIRKTPLAQDDIIPLVYEFLPDNTLQLQARPTATFPDPVKLRLERVSSGSPSPVPMDNTP